MERLLLLQKRLGKADLIKPGRELVREGEVELEELGQKEPRYLVLLSDCLLCCSYKGLELETKVHTKVCNHREGPY